MSKAPIFPISEPQHFIDYGFDPQISYFQVLEEAKRHAKRGLDTKPCLDSVHLKLQKPISKDESRSKRKHHHCRRTSAGKWLRSARSALLFWKRNKEEHSHNHSRSYSRHAYSTSYPTCYSSSYSTSYPICYSSSYSAWGPLYLTESYSRAEAVTCKVKSGPLSVSGPPYFNLTELNLTSGTQSVSGGTSADAMPVYLVT